MLKIERGKATDGGPRLPQMVDAGGQGNFGAQVRGLDLQPRQLVMLRPVPVHLVDEQQIGLPRFHPSGKQAYP